MKYKIVLALLFTLIIASCNKTINCIIETNEGNLLIELYPEKAPISVANFLEYVDKGYYSNPSFYRVKTPENEAGSTIKTEVIQGGILDEEK